MTKACTWQVLLSASCAAILNAGTFCHAVPAFIDASRPQRDWHLLAAEGVLTEPKPCRPPMLHCQFKMPLNGNHRCKVLHIHVGLVWFSEVVVGQLVFWMSSFSMIDKV